MGRGNPGPSVLAFVDVEEQSSAASAATHPEGFTDPGSWDTDVTVGHHLSDSQRCAVRTCSDCGDRTPHNNENPTHLERAGFG